MEKVHYFENLIPFVSTHFKCMGNFGKKLTVGKTYKIRNWYVTDGGGVRLDFITEEGKVEEWERDLYVEDYSFYRNLKKVLEE